MSAQRPSPRKLARDDVACPHQLPYLKAALKVGLFDMLLNCYLSGAAALEAYGAVCGGCLLRTAHCFP